MRNLSVVIGLLSMTAVAAHAASDGDVAPRGAVHVPLVLEVRAERGDAQTLLVRDSSGSWYRASFEQGCRGIGSARVVDFDRVERRGFGVGSDIRVHGARLSSACRVDGLAAIPALPRDTRRVSLVSADRAPWGSQALGTLNRPATNGHMTSPAMSQRPRNR